MLAVVGVAVTQISHKELRLRGRCEHHSSSFLQPKAGDWGIGGGAAVNMIQLNFYNVMFQH